MLEGLKVIEMATYVAAPAAGAMLRDWGAEVIKVEPLNGCPMRRFFEGMKSNVPIEGNPIFTLDNRGKKGISINTSDEKGADIVRELIKDADIFLTNVRPQSLESAKLDHESLLKVNPKLIYCSLTGYGLEGEEKNRPGFDVAAYWSRSGMAHLTQRKGEEPLPIRTASGDHITAISTVSGILAAVYERTKTGKGKVVDCELLKLRERHIPDLRRQLGVVFQDFQLLPDRSVEKNLDFVLRATGWKSVDKRKDRITEVLGAVGLEDKLKFFPHELSGGEQQRIAISRALLNKPKLILADEPTGNLDPITSEEVMKLLHEINQQGTTILMATHDFGLISKFPKRTLMCEDQLVVEVKK